MTTFYHPGQPLSDIPPASGIYRITCIVTKKIYIGSAVSLRRRWKEHRGELRHDRHGNPYLQSAWNKHGEDTFTFEVLEFVLAPLLLEREQYWMDKLKPYEKDKGFNIAHSAWSPLGVKRSPETLEKNRIASTGRTHSPETIELMRASHRATHRTPKEIERVRALQKRAVNARRGRIIAIDPNGTEYEVFGIRQFCIDHNLIDSHLISVAKRPTTPNGKLRHHQRWTARYPETDTK